MEFQKESRLECIYCDFFDKCFRLESNELIMRELKKTGTCYDFKRWTNPSSRIAFYNLSSKWEER